MSRELDHTIYGDDMQAVELVLDKGESVRSEVGSMLYMESSVEMNTTVEGGILGGVKRMISGESFFLTTFTNNSDIPSKVAFAAPYPGKIIALELSESGHYYCQRDSYLCSDNNVDIEIAFTKKLGAGFFGGEGFILQKLTGDGQAFIHAGGTVIKKELSQNETLRIDTGCIVAFSTNVSYDIQFVGGFRNALFGGEGLFLATLSGPGTIYLQSLPFSRMADRIIKASGITPGGRVEESRGLGGSIFKNVLNGN